MRTGEGLGFRLVDKKAHTGRHKNKGGAGKMAQPACAISGILVREETIPLTQPLRSASTMRRAYTFPNRQRIILLKE